MTLIVGIVGKPSSGKSTFLNAACLTDVKVSELPFTTIDANKGIAYAKTNCICKELNIEDNPQNSQCIDGFRFIPINILDVAGLVPDAHKGKGLGNKFLNDLGKADVLIHIVDITGSLDKTGKPISSGMNDPYEDIIFLEHEINLWYKDILKREDWNKFKRTFAGKKKEFIDELYKRLSGIKINREQIIISLKQTKLENKNPNNWDDDDLLIFSKELRELSKPILIIANKIDKKISTKNLETLKKKYKNTIIPCSALAEHLLRQYHEKHVINYIPGSNTFRIVNEDMINTKELETLKKIKTNLLDKYGSTGVQEALNHAIFKISNQICVYPVSDIKTYSDNNNNILPDVFLVEKGTILIDFIKEKIHSDLAKHFIFGIDGRTKKRLGESYELQHNDIIKITSAK
ncbi:MAG: YchF-related putative GTPase [Promethearchaeota archaeon]